MRAPNKVVITNNPAATHTMVGPVRVSNWYAAPKPLRADRLPMAAVSSAMTSGVRANGRATAGGMTRGAPIRSAPTTLIATATVKARAMVSTSCSVRVEIPLDCARSGFSVAVNRLCQRQRIGPTTAAAPLQNQSKVSFGHGKDVPEEVAHQIHSHAQQSIHGQTSNVQVSP